jgi:hypothetical protein
MIVEIISALVILGIGVLFLNPGNLSMPDTMTSMLILGMIVAFLAFAAVVFREKASDERETWHVLAAGRISYLVGVGTIIIGIGLQALKHEIDPWLVIALCAMVLAKLASRIYSRLKM